jgi:hypothetical protein
MASPYWIVEKSDGRFTKLPNEVTARFEKFIYDTISTKFPKFCGESFNEFKNTLKQCGAIIAGGSALRACYDNSNAWGTSSDIDIYVNVKHAFRMKYLIETANYKYSYQYVPSKSRRSNLYCNSFLVKNRIREVITFPSENIDIVSVRNARNVIDVVCNFDLTICQVWYDGENMYATHPDHILAMKAMLQGEYVALYNDGNKFLINRMNKYRSRGFEITLDPNPIIPEKIMPKRHVLYPIVEYYGYERTCYDSEDIEDIPSLKSTIWEFEYAVLNALYNLYTRANGDSKDKDKYQVKLNNLIDYIKINDSVLINTISSKLESDIKTLHDDIAVLNNKIVTCNQDISKSINKRDEFYYSSKYIQKYTYRLAKKTKEVQMKETILFCLK